MPLFQEDDLHNKLDTGNDKVAKRQISQKLDDIGLSKPLAIDIPQLDTFRRLLLTYSDIIKDNDTSSESSLNAIDGKGDNTMDDGYKVLIDRLDQDIRDNRREAADRETRLMNDLKEREDRFMKKMEDIVNTNTQIIDLKLNNVALSLNHMTTDLDKMSSRLDNVDNRFDRVDEGIQAYKRWILASSVSLGIAIVGIVIANWQVISSMLQLVNK